MKKKTLIGRLLHFVFHYEFFLDDYRSKGTSIYPRWRTSTFGIKGFCRYFYLPGENFMADFDSHAEGLEFLMKPDILDYRFKRETPSTLHKVDREGLSQ